MRDSQIASFYTPRKQHDAQQHTQQQPQEQPDPNQQQRIQTFYPSWDDFNHSPSYIEKIIQCICLALLFISTQNWIGQSYSPARVETPCAVRL